MLITPERNDLFALIKSNLVPVSIVEKLAALGITTMDELRDSLAYVDRSLIDDYLGAGGIEAVLSDPGKTLAAATRGPRGRELTRAEPLHRHARGVILSASQKAARAKAPTPRAGAGRGSPNRPRSTPRPTVSLIDRMLPVRDQGSRGTCVAFSTGAYLEFQLAQAAAAEGTTATPARRSEQFVYWACKETDGIPHEEGTFVSVAREVLKRRGACRHTKWKYVSEPTTSEGQGPPPAGAEEEALTARWTGVRTMSAKSVDKLCAALKEQRPVVLSVLTFPGWDFPNVQLSGEIAMPFPGEQSDGGHAICLVGYFDDAALPGGGAFLFRNSWGKTFGRRSLFAAGYGTLPFDYVAHYGLEAFA
jgi:hypothetical protein